VVREGSNLGSPLGRTAFLAVTRWRNEIEQRVDSGE
jgi:hypothetical protein